MPAYGSSAVVKPSEESPAPLVAKLGEYADSLRFFLNELFPEPSALPGFYGMLKYHLGWVDSEFRPRDARSGKSLRPGLCMLVAEGLGAEPRLVTPFAAGIELLHNFSLIHDDIQDHSVTRRGRPTVWTIWGPAQAINAGDAMFSIAHTAWLSSQLGDQSPAIFVEVLRSLEHTVLQLCEGQYLDMAGEGSVDISSNSYMAMVGRKTAALIGEAAWIGARVASSDVGVARAAREFGSELGIAFQIRDDLLGIWGDEREMGKSASSDIATRKMTLPIIVAIESGSAAIRDELRACYGGETELDETRVRYLLDLASAKIVTADYEDRHWQSAMRALDVLPLSTDWKQLIQEFARSFVGRRA